MRWERLFEEIEASAVEADRAGHEAEVADRIRRERARIQLADRLQAAEGTTIAVRVLGAGTVRGLVQRVGGQWVLLTSENGTRDEVVVPCAAILTVAGLSHRAATRPPSSVTSRLGLGHVLRGMSRDRSTVLIVLVDGDRVVGTIDGVGADHADLVPRGPGEPSVDAPPRPVVVIPFCAIATISRSV